jgi:HSP20 family protein
MTLPLQRSAGRAERWRPLREFENLYTEMGRLAQSVFGGLTGEAAWLPAADIVETDSAYITRSTSRGCGAKTPTSR